MTAKEAHTSPEVKQMLVNTPGIPVKGDGNDPFAHWASSGCRPARPRAASPPV